MVQLAADGLHLVGYLRMGGWAMETVDGRSMLV
jgi:hypothetical protein